MINQLAIKIFNKIKVKKTFMHSPCELHQGRVCLSITDHTTMKFVNFQVRRESFGGKSIAVVEYERDGLSVFAHVINKTRSKT